MIRVTRHVTCLVGCLDTSRAGELHANKPRCAMSSQYNTGVLFKTNTLQEFIHWIAIDESPVRSINIGRPYIRLKTGGFHFRASPLLPRPIGTRGPRLGRRGGKLNGNYYIINSWHEDI